MVDITDKKNTLRFASAEAIIIVSNKQTIRAIQKKLYLREMFLRSVELQVY